MTILETFPPKRKIGSCRQQLRCESPPSAGTSLRPDPIEVATNFSTSPRPKVHTVHLYDDRPAFIARLAKVVETELQNGNSAFVIASEYNRQQLWKHLIYALVDVAAHVVEGRFQMQDAKDTLALFMSHGKPDRDLFMTFLDQLKKHAPRNIRSEQDLMVFGEMVAVLWEEGNKEAALQLEALWNEALDDHPFRLHCAYPRWTVMQEAETKSLTTLCHIHSHIYM